MKVTELMQRRVATTTLDDRLDAAARTMRDRGCGFLPVVDGERRVVAVLTDRDALLAALDHDLPLSDLRVGCAARRTVHACRPDDDVLLAEQTMGLRQVRRLPVVDERGVLVGVLSLDDVAREALRERDLLAPPVPVEAVGRTRGEITRPGLIGELLS